MSVTLVLLQFLLLCVTAWPTASMRFGVSAIAAMLLGSACGLWALCVNRPGNFNIRPDPKPGGMLIQSGPYRRIRHPMYLAVLLVAFGFAASDPRAWRWSAWVALAVVLHVKASVEERKMLETHAGYRDYRARTARLIPFLW